MRSKASDLVGVRKLLKKFSEDQLKRMKDAGDTAILVWNPMSTHKWRSLTCTCIYKLIAMKQRIHRLVSLDRQPRHIPCIMTPVPWYLTCTHVYTVLFPLLCMPKVQTMHTTHITPTWCNPCYCSPNTTLSTARTRTSNIEQGICPIPLPCSMLPRQKSNLLFILHSSRCTRILRT